MKVKHKGCHGTSVPGGVGHLKHVMPLELNAYHSAQKHAMLHAHRVSAASSTLLHASYTPLTRLLHASYTTLTCLYTPLTRRLASPPRCFALLTLL